MAIPAGHSRCSIVGTLADGAEEFSTSFWINSAGATQAATQELAERVANAVELGLPQLTNLIAADSRYTELRMYSYPQGGRRAEFAASVALENGTGSGAASIPLQCCLVGTLNTGVLGRSNRGRMYIPASGCAPVAHHSTATDAQRVRDALAAIFEAVNLDQNIGQVVVVSVTRGSSRAVTSVSCDTRFDIQRRRADNQPGIVRYESGLIDQ